MKFYLITVNDDFFKKQFTGQFRGETKEDAEKDCKDFYAHELGTNPDKVEIVNTVEVVEKLTLEQFTKLSHENRLTDEL